MKRLPDTWRLEVKDSHLATPTLALSVALSRLFTCKESDSTAHD